MGMLSRGVLWEAASTEHSLQCRILCSKSCFTCTAAFPACDPPDRT